MVTRGEPRFVQIVLYASADFGARNGTIKPFTNNARSRYGLSMTLLSIKNSLRYRRTSGTSVLFGEPRLIMINPLFASFIARRYECTELAMAYSSFLLSGFL